MNNIINKKVEVNKSTESFDTLFEKIKSLDKNDDQQMLIMMVLLKLKEWLEFEEKKKKDPSAIFEPLHLTIIGEGGTGKSFIIELLCSIMQHLFPQIDTTIKAAPTGAAAFNILSRTIHAMFSIVGNIGGYNKTIKNKNKLIKKFRRKLMMILDERSMISQELIGAIHKILTQTLHGGNKKNEEPFGGLPIVIILGDDHQLPSVVDKSGWGKGATYIKQTAAKYRDDIKRRMATNKDRVLVEKQGKTMFLHLAKKMISFKQNYRTNEGQKELSEIQSKLREDGLSPEQCIRLQRLETKNILQEELDVIKKKSIFIFATKKDAYQHNMNQLSQLVNPTNPLCIIKTKKIGQTQKYDDLPPPIVGICRGARVAIRGKNFNPEWGLFNGSVGIVVSIQFDNNKNPNNDDLPDYVVVDFPNYIGPVWNEQFKTVSYLTII